MRQVVCHHIAVARFYINLQLQISDETSVNVGSKACNESKDGKKDVLLFVLQQKLLQKEKQ